MRASRIDHGQRGAALLLILLVVIVAASAVLASQLSDRRRQLDRVNDSREALAAAKYALIGFAATYADLNPGQPLQLPCPDIDGSGPFQDGDAHTSACGAAGVAVVGRLPWRTLGGPVLHDASGACLWYAVSGSYKSAGSATAAMINPDSNGQLQLFSVDTGAILEGVLPEDRPVAIVMAPMDPLTGQIRSGIGVPGQICSNDFSAADFLDTAAGLGISNANVSGVADAIEVFAARSLASAQHNDQVLTVSRVELAQAVYDRADFTTRMSVLARGVASCVAAYGRQNPAGVNDRRLPWPSPVGLLDYATDAGYDDQDTGVYSGRLPDIVDTSNGATGNGIARVITDCDPALAPDWDASLLPLWRQWKDHLFYAVAESFQPGAPVPSACGSCLTVNAGGTYAAIVWFADGRLTGLGQQRDAPPMDTDSRDRIDNYLEGRNAANHPYTGGAADFESRAAAADFNDVAFCIDAGLGVDAC